jgi:hypothetical protein
MSGIAEPGDAVQAAVLAASTAMEPVEGTVDVDLPAAALWECFRHANLWPRWNACMFWVQNRDLVVGNKLIWAFEPIRWWYLYKLPAIATIVEVAPERTVTWEIAAVPGFYARHSFFVEDLGGGRSRFGSTEKAMGPTFEAARAFWIAHFEFVRDASLEGARLLADVQARTGRLDESTLPSKSYAKTLAALFIVLRIASVLRGILRRIAGGRDRG